MGTLKSITRYFRFSRRLFLGFAGFIFLSLLNAQPGFSQATDPVAFRSFEFGELRGPLAHEAFVPISGDPIAGISHAAVATLTGSFDTAAFRLVSLTGSVIQAINLAMPFDNGSRTGFAEFTGSFIPPNQAFQVAVSGVDTSGAAYDILLPKIFTPQTVEVSFDRTTVNKSGNTSTLFIDVTNHGGSGSFSIDVTGIAIEFSTQNPRGDITGLITRISPTSFLLGGGGGTISVEVDIKPPSGTPVDTGVILTAVATNTSNSNIANKDVFTFPVVIDTTPPTVNPPPNVTVSSTGALTAVSTGQATATDDVGVFSLSSNSSGLFPVGINEVTWVALDAAGNIGTATQTVTVVDNTGTDNISPTIIPPPDVTVAATGTLTLVDIGSATATDNVSSSANIAITNNASASFSVGTTTVTWTATDEAGNSASATQTVTVAEPAPILDTTPPVVTAPADVTVDSTGALTPVDIGVATATDNVGVVLITNDAIGDSPPPSFPVGTTVVTWSAEDAAGNVGTATQTVTVFATAPPGSGTVIFDDDINGTNGTRLDAHVPDIVGTSWSFLIDSGQDILLAGNGTARSNSNRNSTALLYSANPAPTQADVDIIVDMNAIDRSSDDSMILVFRYQDASNFYGLRVTSNSTSRMRLYKVVAGTSTLLGTSANRPDISNTSIKIEARGNALKVYEDRNQNGAWNLEVDVTDSALPGAGKVGYGLGAVIIRTDDSKTNPVLDKFTVQEFGSQPPSSIPTITPPADVTVEASGALTAVVLGVATASDFEDGPLVPTHNAPVSFPVGVTDVLYSVTDSDGNTATAVQKVTVVDTTPPVLTIPGTVPVEATGFVTPVALGVATAIDLVDGGITPINNAPAGGFPVGISSVTYTATDSAGNLATGAQTVTVLDTTPPVVTAPGDVTVEATGTLTAVAIGNATAIDLVSGGITATNNAPASFSVGTTTVTWTAIDGAGNSASATQTVTVTEPAPVLDTTPPVVTAPGDVTVDSTGTLTPVDIGSATATDNVGVVLITNDAPAGGFPVGTTVVTWSAEDVAGNIGTATQNVTVNAAAPPGTSTVIFDDNLNGTSGTKLDAHVPDIAGNGWSFLIDPGRDIVLNGNGTAEASSEQNSTGILYSANPAPTQADVDIIVDMNAIDRSSDDSMILVFRYQDASNFYALRVTASWWSKMRLYKVVAGTSTLLGTSMNRPDRTNTSIKIEARGNALRVYEDRNQNGTWNLEIDVTDSSIPAAGKVGYGLGGVIIRSDDIKIDPVLDKIRVEEFAP